MYQTQKQHRSAKQIVEETDEVGELLLNRENCNIDYIYFEDTEIVTAFTSLLIFWVPKPNNPGAPRQKKVLITIGSPSIRSLTSCWIQNDSSCEIKISILCRNTQKHLYWFSKIAFFWTPN